MTIRETDARQDEADRIHDDLVRQGYSATVVRALLPALVGSPENAEDAMRWMNNNGARTGYGDYSEEFRHAESVLGKRARNYLNGMLEEGAITDPFQQGTRYAASDETMSRMLDERAPIASPYSDHRNFQVANHADAEAELDKRHEFHIIDADNPAQHWGN